MQYLLWPPMWGPVYPGRNACMGLLEGSHITRITCCGLCSGDTWSHINATFAWNNKPIIQLVPVIEARCRTTQGVAKSPFHICDWMTDVKNQGVLYSLVHDKISLLSLVWSLMDKWNLHEMGVSPQKPSGDKIKQMWHLYTSHDGSLNCTTTQPQANSRNYFIPVSPHTPQVLILDVLNQIHTCSAQGLNYIQN